MRAIFSSIVNQVFPIALKPDFYFMLKHFFRAAGLCLLLAKGASAQNRITQSINTSWNFHKGDVSAGNNVGWEKVSLPHSWNTTDVYDDIPGYYRGIGWYKKMVYIPSGWKNKSIFLHFEGANQIAEVFVNGQSAGKHIGGYGAFNIPLNQFLKLGTDSLTANEIAVKLDNSNNPDIAPLSADFTFYGGIYRDVFLVAADQVHFNTDQDASTGIIIKTNNVSETGATAEISASVSNTSKQVRNLMVVSEITDAQGKTVAHKESKLNVKPSANAEVLFSQQLAKPHLWSPDEPYLYHVICRIVDAKTKMVLDEQSNPLGLRWFSFDADKGFFLNGKPVKLMGANRHQDFKDLGNALPNALHDRDIQLLKDMGANFIRIAHYPQDPKILEACDRIGILASVEIPIVNEITESQTFADNCLNMQREMIAQNRNHPAVIIWAYMNEVMLRPHFKRGTPEQKTYFANIVKLARSIDSLTHQLDPSRYTMIPCHGDFNLYTGTGLAKVPQIVGWNLYSGWYGAGLEGFEKFLDRHHKELSDKPTIITEYGADADIHTHSLNPERFDKSVEYQVIYHAHYLQEMMKRPFVAGGALWNLVDFNSEPRTESTPHINTKGLTTDAREPKEGYFLYQANLLKQPFLKLGGNQWLLRSGIAGADGTCVQSINVFSNQPEVELWLNGKSLGKAKTNMGYASFKIPFVNGINTLKATTGNLEDFQTVNFKTIPAKLNNNSTPFTELNVSLGDRRFYSDDKLQQVWLPEQAYTPGSWGYVGGEEFKMENTSRVAFGSDKAILNTQYGAIYETQRIGLEAFKADVPDGEYEITLHFAELQGKYMAEALVYNLSNSAPETQKTRAFDVLVNGQTVIDNLNNSNYLLPQTAYSTTTKVTVQGGKGITISFKQFQGQTILNAVQLKKIY